ncbi:MAG: beta-lactamase family protein [Lachnospiraceae bacterium]|nr:beta-lactamase family protein [Lachnospiraceae bacterium]
MKKSKILVTAVSLALLLSGCGAKKPQAPQPYQELFTGGSFDEYMVWTTDDEQYSDLISQLSAKCENILEGSLLVATDAKVIYAGGWNSIETDGETRVNPFTTYEIGSVTKQMTAACILQQVQAGNLRTDETIDKFFPEFPHAHKITIDNLLHMDSGIVDYVNNPYKFYKGSGIDAVTKYTDGKMADEEILSYLNQTELEFEPGTKFAYSNTNYYLLALILEQVTGETYAEYIQKNIFDVCGMQNSTSCEVGNISSVPAEMSGGEYMQAGKSARGAGDVHSNVCDMLLWDRALMSNKVIDANQLEYMTQMRNGYSCGWMESEGRYLEHTGSTMAYVSSNTILEVDGLGKVYVVVMMPNVREGYFLKTIADIVVDYFK